MHRIILMNTIGRNAGFRYAINLAPHLLATCLSICTSMLDVWAKSH